MGRINCELTLNQNGIKEEGKNEVSSCSSEHNVDLDAMSTDSEPTFDCYVTHGGVRVHQS